MSMTQAEGLLPAYLPFSTFRSAVQSLRAHGLPPKIDKTAWDSRSGADQTLIIGAFKFLKLIDDSDNTLPTLRSLVDSTENTLEEKQVLKSMLLASYDTLFKLDLKTATPFQIVEAIGSYGGVKGSARVRAVRFFLKASNHCGIPLSSRLTKKLRDRSGQNEGSQSDEADTASSDVGTVLNGAAPPKARKKRRVYTLPPGIPVSPPQSSGTAVKVITFRIPGGGTLTLSGTFNPFELDGVERKLVYEIIDLMKVYEHKTETTSA